MTNNNTKFIITSNTFTYRVEDGHGNVLADGINTLEQAVIMLNIQTRLKGGTFKEVPYTDYKHIIK